MYVVYVGISWELFHKFVYDVDMMNSLCSPVSDVNIYPGITITVPFTSSTMGFRDKAAQNDINARGWRSGAHFRIWRRVEKCQRCAS